MAYPETSNLGYVEPRDGDPADIQVINQYFTAKADEDIYLNRCMIAPFYSNEAGVVYNTGDIVQYERVVYKCLEDNVTGNWDATKWEQTTVAKEVGQGGGSAEVTKEASGNPIELTDAASAPLVKCMSAITGSQDLHGYDKPWVGGAGKNKFDTDSVYSDTSKYTISNGEVTATAYNFTLAKVNIPSSMVGSPVTFSALLTVPSETSELFVMATVNGVNNKGTSVMASSQGLSSVTFTPTSTNDVVFINYASGGSGVCKASQLQLEVGSAPTTFAPYSNICPITAYTEGEIEVRGKNIFDGETEAGYIYKGTFYSSNTYKVTKNFIPVKPNTSYKAVGVNGDGQITCYSESKTYLSSIPGMGGETRTFTTPSDCYFIKFYNPNAYMDGNVGINYPPTFTEYEPYASTTHTTTYPSAIYRGSEDVVKGEVTSDMSVIDLGDLNWNVTNSNYFYVNIPGVFDSSEPLVCECFNYIGSYTAYNTSSFPNDGDLAYSISSEGRIAVRCDRVSSASDFINLVTGMKLAYKLPTPTTSSVTPTNLPIKSLNGYTHIESSTGEMEVEYITSEYQPLVDLIQSNKHVYSTAEQIVGTWIDGKTVYEITYYFNAIQLQAANTWTDTNITRTDIEHVLSCYGYRNDTNFLILNCGLNASNHIVVMQTRNSMIDGFVGFTIRYTKTTATRSLSKSAPIEDLSSEEEKSLKTDENVVKTNDTEPEEVNEK